MRQQTSLIRPQMLLLQALGLLMLGILIIVRPEIINAVLQYVLVGALLINCALSFITLWNGKAVREKFKNINLEEPETPRVREKVRVIGNDMLAFMHAQGRMPLMINALLSITLSALVLIFPEIIEEGFGLGFGIWALLTGFVQSLYSWQLYSTRTRGMIRYMLFAIISVIFGLSMVINPIARLINVRIVSGIYLMLFGFTVFVEFLEAMFKWDMENSRFLMHVRILPPVAFTSFLPVWLLDRFNRMLERNNTDHIYEKLAPGEPQPDMSKNNLEILFHMGRNVAMGYGHVDFAVGDTVYSYGCYDDASARMMGFFSDGTFMTTKLKPYLDYCRRWQKKTMVSFTMRLTVEQEKAVRSALEDMLSQCREWHPTEKNSPAIGMSAHQFKMLNMKFYKISSGPFQIYSALRTNCVSMAEIVIGQTGLRVLPTHGIITPGSYYAFLDRQLRDPDSPVIRKTVHKRSQRHAEDENAV